MDWGQLAEAIRPWVSTTALVTLAGIVVKLWLDNKKLNIDSEGGIRDHYAKEVAGLRAQVLAVQQAATLAAAAAEDRYNKAVTAADERHGHCEEECARLRDEFRALERKYAALHAASLRTFQPRDDLHPEVLKYFRSLEQGQVPPPDAVGVLVLDQPCPPLPDIDDDEAEPR